MRLFYFEASKMPLLSSPPPLNQRGPQFVQAPRRRIFLSRGTQAAPDALSPTLYQRGQPFVQAPCSSFASSSSFFPGRSKSVCGAWSGQYEGLHITTRRTHCGLPGWPVPREGFCAAGSSEMSASSFVRYLRGYRRRFDLDISFETEVIWAEREASATRGHGDTPAAGCLRVQLRRWVVGWALFGV